MGDENEVMPCCRRYGRPHEQCDRYPACDGCHDLVDEAATAATGQPSETDLDLSGLAPEAESGVRDFFLL